MSIQYYLLPNTATPDPNDQSARVNTTINMNEDQLAQELVNRGVATSKAQAAAVIAGYQQLIAEKVADGAAINTQLFTARPGITGVFTDPNDTFDPARHTLSANLQSGPLLREKLSTATTQKIIRPEPAPILVSFTNNANGAVNTSATPAGIGQIRGDQLKFDPTPATAGIYFIPATGSAVKVPTANIATRTEGELLFTIPALAAGTYRLEVRRIYGTGSNATLRTGQLGSALTVA